MTCFFDAPGFSVERARDDEPFRAIGFVEGPGTTQEDQSYSFVDRTIEPGVYSYRLKQVDFDGTFEYSETVEVSIEVPGKFYLCYPYPNLFNPTAVVEFAVVVDEPVDLELADSSDRIVQTLFSGSARSDTGRRVTIDGSDLPSGAVLRPLARGFILSREIACTGQIGLGRIRGSGQLKRMGYTRL